MHIEHDTVSKLLKCIIFISLCLNSVFSGEEMYFMVILC